MNQVSKENVLRFDDAANVHRAISHRLHLALQILERSSETSNSHDRADTLSSQLSDAHTLTSEPNNDEDVADVLTTSERFLLPASLSMPSDRAFVDSICEDRDDDPYFSFRATILK